MNRKNFKLPVLLLSLLIFPTSCEQLETSSQAETRTSYPVIQTTAPIVTSAATQANNFTPLNDNSTTYVLNANSKKIHYVDCPSVNNMKEENKVFTDDYEDAVNQGYEPCRRCNP